MRPGKIPFFCARHTRTIGTQFYGIENRIRVADKSCAPKCSIRGISYKDKKNYWRDYIRKFTEKYQEKLRRTFY